MAKYVSKNIERLVESPLKLLNSYKTIENPHIPLPQQIFTPKRRNSVGITFSHYAQLKTLTHKLDKTWQQEHYAGPFLRRPAHGDKVSNVLDPSDHSRIIGQAVNGDEKDCEQALARATRAFATWHKVDVEDRAALLERIADILEEHHAELMGLIVREGGRVLPDANSEVREAIDFCRYYAQMARETLTDKSLPGYTGETNVLRQHGRGVILCISPWNFPVAIFTGQVVAAVVAGNTVIAKPAENTRLVAARVVELFYEAGLPEDVVIYLPGSGSTIGAKLVADPGIAGVMLTGSTETARTINRTLAERPGPIVPFIAETGGQNAMIADSTALPEQLVADVLQSAFGSAGQRCSALRVLFLQEEIADRVIEMLRGAMAELVVGDPAHLDTDVGPVIDKNAQQSLQAHCDLLSQKAKLIYRVELPEAAHKGTYIAPQAYELPDLQLLTKEHFGPILHVIRYRRDDLYRVIEQINALGYGLTFGLQSRINHTVQDVTRRIHAGNIYVNRNMIGAVVGVQPFGGSWLSGTGPKAGGPHYLLRLCHESTLTINTTAAGGNASLMALADET